MNKHEEKTVKQESQRFSKDIVITQAGAHSLKLELPFMSVDLKPLYFFVSKRKDSKKFSLLIPVESTGLVAVNDTLARLQPMLETYGLLLSQEAVIMEESHISLHKRISNMTQALIAIDGIRRLWKVEYETRRIDVTESKGSQSTSHSPDDRPS